MAELLFEKFDAGAVFVSKSAPLNLYACARSSGVVLDIGADLSVASYVTEGFLQKKAVLASPLGGRLLCQTMLERLEKRGIQVHPRFTFTRKVTRDGKLKIDHVSAPSQPSFAKFWKLDEVESMLHAVCRVRSVAAAAIGSAGSKTGSSAQVVALEGDHRGGEPAAAEGSAASPASVRESDTYMLPDGTAVSSARSLGAEVAELLFDPHPLQRSDIGLGLPDLVLRAGQGLPSADARRELLANVVLCGGLTVAPGLAARFAGELATKARGIKSRVIVSGPNERRYNAWIGGSILGTLNGLSDVWVSRSEYLDQGSKALGRKCP
mmetsp:Transcript_10770/g.30543  ORF Transcript_10770/g.30543 Transcript_10770/m.30543 type:complete len:323 (-) Transcript_10770:2076-3044(-)